MQCVCRSLEGKCQSLNTIKLKRSSSISTVLQLLVINTVPLFDNAFNSPLCQRDSASGYRIHNSQLFYLSIGKVLGLFLLPLTFEITKISCHLSWYFLYSWIVVPCGHVWVSYAVMTEPRSPGWVSPVVMCYFFWLSLFLIVRCFSVLSLWVSVCFRFCVSGLCLLFGLM